MHIEIVYDSLTGTTAKAAKSMGEMLEAQGHQCRIQKVSDADPLEVTQADLIIVGGWVQGLFIVLQHPSEGAIWFINRLGELSGKKAVVFCTYKIASGSTLKQLAGKLEQKGAEVIGQFKFRGSRPDAAFENFMETLS